MSFVVGLEITRACNFRCTHCFVDAGPPREAELTTPELAKVIDQMAACGVETVGWSGGEPLIRRDLEELTYHGAGRGLRFSLATNGYLATRQRLVSLKACGISVIQISLDGISEVKAERFRRGPTGSFAKIQKAIEDAASVGMLTYVCTLLTPETAGEIDEMRGLAEQLGAHGLRYTLWAPVGRASDGAYDEEAWRAPAWRGFFAAVARARDSGDPFRVIVDCPTGPYPGRRRFRCGAGPSGSYVTATGDVYPCTALMVPEYLLGNVRQQPLRELIFGPEVLKIRAQIAGRLPGGACEPCVHRESCRGACPGRTLAAFGSLDEAPNFGASPVCLQRLHGVGC